MDQVTSYTRLPAAGLLFFVSAWLLMIFAGIGSQNVGIKPFGYTTALLVTIALWLVMAPAIGAVARGPAKK
jgi:hypothetical protein